MNVSARSTPQTSGLTLVELLVAISLIAVFAGLAVTYGPKLQQTPDQSRLVSNVRATLESAHSQAVGDRHNTALQAAGDTLTIQALGGSETERFEGSHLAGALTVYADGRSEGSINVTVNTCELLTLLPSGISSSQPCPHP